MFKFILVHKLLLDKFQFCDKTRSRRIITAGWLVGWLFLISLKPPSSFLLPFFPSIQQNYNKFNRNRLLYRQNKASKDIVKRILAFIIIIRIPPEEGVSFICLVNLVGSNSSIYVSIFSPFALPLPAPLFLSFFLLPKKFRLN